MHAALLNTHWVKEVSLEKAFPAKIEMVIEFRKQGWNNLTEKDIQHIERITQKVKENLKS